MSDTRGARRFWVFSPVESVVLVVLLVGLISAVAIKLVQRTRPAGDGMQVITVREEFQHQINLNTASQQELILVPGIGNSRARKILDYRRKQGRFTMVSDLAKLGGFNPKLVEQLSPYLFVDPQDWDGAQ